MAAEDLVAHGARSSTAMVFAKLSQNIPVSAPQVLTLYMLNFFWGNINTYLHFMSFLHIDLTQVLKILPQVRPDIYILHS